MALSDAIDQSAVARVVGIKTEFVATGGGARFLPQVVGLIGQGRSDVSFSTDKVQITSALEAAQIFGFGSPIHLAARELKPDLGGGLSTIPLIVHPVADAPGSVAAVFNVEGTGTQTEAKAFSINVNGIESQQFVIGVGQSFADVAAIVADRVNAILEMPVIASEATGVLVLTAKWKGESSNMISVEVEGVSDDITFAVSQPTNGLINPDVDPALAQIGEVWETMLLNCMNYDDTDTLDKIQAFGEPRWLPIVHKPFVAFVGNTEVGSTISSVTDTRKTDRINAQLSAPDSVDLPFVVAAAQLAAIAVQANNNPPVDYGSTPIASISAGKDSLQLNYTQRDVIVKQGASTVTVRDGVVNLEDIITMYHPTGDQTPPWRYVVDIVKEMQVIYNIALIFVGKPWDGAPLIPDDQPTVNPDARKPKDAIAELAVMTDNLGDEAILSDPAGTKPLIMAEISSQNPKRLDICYPHNVSGNANIISIDSKFSFFFG